MPAQSPTLSPTLSAIVAGLRGSSSGIPASTLPTMSPPTSAPLVKMPPPSRAKIEINDQHAGHRAGPERDREALRQALTGGFGGAYIGPHRNIHPDVAGRTGKYCADHIADADFPTQKEEGKQKNHHASDGNCGVLPVQVGGRALLDGCGDLLHARIAGAEAKNGTNGPGAVK